MTRAVKLDLVWWPSLAVAAVSILVVLSRTMELVEWFVHQAPVTASTRIWITVAVGSTCLFFWADRMKGNW